MNRLLTDRQLHLLSEQGLWADKTALASRVKGCLMQVGDPLHMAVSHDSSGWHLPPGFNPAARQFTRGEQLQDCPYQSLDCPSHFGRDDWLTLRTMVWWGHGIYSCWIIKGTSVPGIARLLRNQAVDIVADGADWQVWHGQDPWQWDQAARLIEVERWVSIQPSIDYLKFGTVTRFSATALQVDELTETVMAVYRAGARLLQRSP